MELSSSKRIKVEQLVGSNLLDDVTFFDSSRSLSRSSDPDLNFDALRWTPIFVDKSMLIRSIMKDKNRRILLTAPPRFGKTMACNMLEIFFEIVNDEQKLEKYKLFKDLKINKCAEECTDNHDCENKRFFRQHCGQYPVISLDFAELSATSYRTFLRCLRNMIAHQFKKYEAYLIHEDGEKFSWSNKNMGKLKIKRFLRYLEDADEDDYWKETNEDEKEVYIFEAFEYLIQVLSAHYETKQTHKKIIVLIDEFDAPFMKLLFREHSDERIITLLQGLMRLLCKAKVSAEFVERVVIFSVTALGGMISLGANNVARRTFLDKDYDYYKFFGFTKKEVEDLVKRTVTESQRQKAVLDEIAIWYNNYTVIGDNDTTICNPVSIGNYLPKLVRRSYWVESVGTKCVCQLFKFEKIREKLFPAVRDDHNIFINATTIQLGDISNLKSLSESIFNCSNDQQVDLALQFLTECGYFNVVEKKSTNWILQIPNQELKETFTDKLYHALLSVKTNLFDVKQQESFVNALESLGCEEEHEPMKYVAFKKSVENLYTNRELPKAQFHFHCDLWMLTFGSGKFHCFSELPIEKGWSPKLDLIIITKSAAIMIEVKRHKQDSAKKALEQCLQKEYYKSFELKGNKRNKILMGLHLSDDGKVSIRYFENFEGKTLPDKQNRKTLIKAIVETSQEC